MASSPDDARRLAAGCVAAALVLGATAACAIGGGEGEFFGEVRVEECKDTGDYHMRPNFFGAEAVEELLEIRVQKGSGLASVSDGVYVLVRDARDLQQNHLGEELTIDNDEGPVGVTFYLNATCPLSRSRSPVTLPATGGTIRFDAIYSPMGPRTDVEIAAELTEVTFEDPRNINRRATLSGRFRFLYERGRPAQLFP